MTVYRRLETSAETGTIATAMAPMMDAVAVGVDEPRDDDSIHLHLDPTVHHRVWAQSPDRPNLQGTLQTQQGPTTVGEVARRRRGMVLGDDAAVVVAVVKREGRKCFRPQFLAHDGAMDNESDDALRVEAIGEDCAGDAAKGRDPLLLP